MRKKSLSIQSTLLILVVGFFIIVFAGRFFFQNTINNPTQVSSATNSNQQASTSLKVATSSVSTQLPSKTVSDATTSPALSCSDTITKELTTKKESYVKGQILVTFNSTITYQKAKDVLAVYGLVVSKEIESQSSFQSRHLITAAVAPGQEIIKVCQLRSDAQVKYAGLDLYFGIHQ